MIAKRKSDGKIIEVKPINIQYPAGLCETGYEDDKDCIYLKSELDLDLDFDVEEAEQTESVVISGWVAKLREVLESHFAHRILHSEIDEIINQVKKEI